MVDFRQLPPPRNTAFNTLLTLCVCVLLVYQMQDIALERMTEMNRRGYSRPPIQPLSSIKPDRIEALNGGHDREE